MSSFTLVSIKWLSERGNIGSELSKLRSISQSEYKVHCAMCFEETWTAKWRIKRRKFLRLDVNLPLIFAFFYFTDVVLPTVLIALLFVGNAIIVYIIFQYRKRWENNSTTVSIDRFKVLIFVAYSIIHRNE